MITFRVRSERDLASFRYWARRLPLFDDATRDVCVVDVTLHGTRIAEIDCQDERLAYGAECIATYVCIQREFGYEGGWA